LAERLYYQIFAEIDCMHIETPVFIIGATNRPERIYPDMFYNWFADYWYSILKTQVRNGFTSANIGELCQKVLKTAIRELIERKQRMTSSSSVNDNLNDVNEVVKIRRNHFEKVMLSRGCYPSLDNVIRKYEIFAQIWNSHSNYKSSFHTIKNDIGKKY